MRTSHARGDVGRAPLMSIPLEPRSAAARIFVLTGGRALHTTKLLLVLTYHCIGHTVFRMLHLAGITDIEPAKLTIG